MLEKTILSLVRLDSDTLGQFVSLFTQVNLEKGTAFARSGEYSTHIAFINSGVMRAFFRKKNGETYNKTLFTDHSFVGAYSSLVTGQENQIDIDCLTDCNLWIAPYKRITQLYDPYPRIERLARILAEQFFVTKEKREIELVTLDATERYAIFQREYPDLELKIPQYHIASYLGVSPTQLSRIRARKSK